MQNSDQIVIVETEEVLDTESGRNESLEEIQPNFYRVEMYRVRRSTQEDDEDEDFILAEGGDFEDDHALI